MPVSNQPTGQASSQEKKSELSIPSISVPKGGGAIRGIGEKFAANPVTGTGSMTVPIATSPGRSGFGPQLALSYDSGAGNGPFGFGWSLSLPSITRKTDKGLPKYDDAHESDVFILSGAEDLVPMFKKDLDGNWERDAQGNLKSDEDPELDGYRVRRYRPRIEGLFARIERWTRQSDGDIHWRSISKDNVVTVYGRDSSSRIVDPADPHRIFSWLICESYDDKGNAIVYEYKPESELGVDPSNANERNRLRTANRYLKRIQYGNRQPLLLDTTETGFRKSHLEMPDFASANWMFEVVFDYDEDHYSRTPPDNKKNLFVTAQINPPPGIVWPVRQDSFSSYRPGFEVRTYRLCRRVLMFHHFPQELGVDDYLVRSTELNYRESPIASFITGVTQCGYVHKPSDSDQNRYLRRSLPPVEFEYSQAQIDETIREIDAESLENLPLGVDSSRYQWVDLDGEGISGILSEQADAWFYKPNLSTANTIPDNGSGRTAPRFGPLEIIAVKPNTALSTGHTQFMDLAGDGQLDLVEFSGAVPGFYERTGDQGWEPFRPFTSLPNIPWNDPNLRFVDLTGDGHADILITENDVFTWYPSLAEGGFDLDERTYPAFDEEQGPRLVFADGTQSVYLADLSGDGLTDLVRIRNGEVCYWPNLGYGRFGAKVTMDNSPWFDAPDLFDQRRIRLADIDGSGTTDIIYLSGKGVAIYRNECGNGWSALEYLKSFPPIDDITSVVATDLLGKGTACLVWSSPLPGNARSPMRYVDLMGGEKPHLLINSKNNLGAETHVQYAPSTKFYLKDKSDGKPWITRLPFPVHVVERVETYDRISRNRFVTRYQYHHGYYDGVEREFRGFGMVDQKDTEEIGAVAPGTTVTEDTNWDAESFVPPVLTRTWFHTGAFIEAGRISKQFEHEYYREGDASRGEAGLSDLQLETMLLKDTVLPDSIRAGDGTRFPYVLSGDEVREAYRSLKGSILRQEEYTLDGTDEADRPYTVSERNYTIELLQPRDRNRHAVFCTHARETVDFHYERKLVDIGSSLQADPRVTHALTLKADEFGNVERSVAVGYRRRNVPELHDPEQKETHLTFTVSRFANSADQRDWHRVGLPVETRTFEIVKPPEPSVSSGLVGLFAFEDIAALTEGLFPSNLIEPEPAKIWPYDCWDWRRNSASAPAETKLRLIEQIRTTYRTNDLTAMLPLGQIESLTLPGESYKLAFTSEFAKTIYVDSGKLPAQDADQVLGTSAGYVHSEGDANWWIPSGCVFYSPNSIDTAIQELAFAQEHFFLPHRFHDPFNNVTKLAYDSDSGDPARNHNLLLVETQDALGNVVTVKTTDDLGGAKIRNDYRVLQPFWVTDPNGNRTRVAFDALGLVVATAVMGKPGEKRGDRLESTFDADPDLPRIQGFVQDPRGKAKDLIESATTRIVYDLDRFQRCQEPPFADTLAREIHAGDPGGGNSPIQINFLYSDGFGREIQTKIQAEPGDAPKRDKDVGLSTGDIQLGDLLRDVNNQLIQEKTSHRWVGKGRTVYNNKGKPVKQYEPFFSSTHLYEEEREMTDAGVTPVLFYDPVERVIATLHPNHTYEKVVFDPWQQTTWDMNDTVLLDPRNDPDIKGFVSAYFSQQSSDWTTWFRQRLPDYDKSQPLPDPRILSADPASAAKTIPHADTPTVAFFDTLGRAFLTRAHNRFERRKDDNSLEIVDETPYPTRVVFDIDGNQRAVIDAKGRTVMSYDYDMLSNSIKQDSMDAGIRWMLSDVAGKPIRSWDSRNHEFNYSYDALRRPIGTRVKGGDGPAPLDNVYEKIIYGEGQSLNGKTDIELNLRGRPFAHYDTGGKVQFEEYDFKGNPIRSHRRLAIDYKGIVQWDVADPESQLEDETFVTVLEHDALNRVTSSKTPDGSITRPFYNEANLLEKVNVDQAGIGTDFVTNIDYNEKGQRLIISCGNGVNTTYAYDRETFRLMHLQTRKAGGEPLQDLYYTYDPVGNITQIEDRARPTIFFGNMETEPVNEFSYDALYRLTEADGREHIAQVDFGGEESWNDIPFLKQYSVNDPMAWRNYTQQYQYDEVGNILQMKHVANGGSWTRDYEYETANNRLKTTTVGTTTYIYPHHPAHGFIESMPHLQVMTWNFKDELRSVARQRRTDSGTPETTYYVYDAAGQRIRKVTENTADVGVPPTKKSERIYVGGIEIYRGCTGNHAGLERKTLQVMDDKSRIAMIETRNEVDEGTRVKMVRYQFNNHLGTACLEVDDTASVISYEEYHPYGTTSYQAVDKDIKAAAKRYRYTGKERDEESGLYYHGARYYLSWLARWCSSDPAWVVGGFNLFVYCFDNPIVLKDIDGLQPTEHPDEQRKVDRKESKPLAAEEQNSKDKSQGSTPQPNESRKSLRLLVYHIETDGVAETKTMAEKPSTGKWDKTRYVSSFSAIASSVEKLSQEYSITSLGILVHGDASGQLMIGAEKINASNIQIEQLKSLADHLAPDAKIYLYGCVAGLGEEGTKFLTLMSKYLPGRTLIGFNTLTFDKKVEPRKEGAFLGFGGKYVSDPLIMAAPPGVRTKIAAESHLQGTGSDRRWFDSNSREANEYAPQAKVARNGKVIKLPDDEEGKIEVQKFKNDQQ